MDTLAGPEQKVSEREKAQRERDAQWRENQRIKSVSAAVATCASKIRSAALDLQTNPQRNDAAELQGRIKQQAAELAQFALQF